jgi:hypothetical protein
MSFEEFAMACKEQQSGHFLEDFHVRERARFAVFWMICIHLNTVSFRRRSECHLRQDPLEVVQASLSASYARTGTVARAGARARARARARAGARARARAGARAGARGYGYGYGYGYG